MGSVSPFHQQFDVLHDTRPEDVTLPAFMVSRSRGFLPRQEPVVALPAEFESLESILTRMPIKTAAGTPGLLATYSLGSTLMKELPNLMSAINKYEDNLPLMNALYRDYSFLASAYLLEPCHERHMKGEGYGLGRQTLPAVISLPITRCAELAGFKPFMEYAGSYALYNYRLDDPKKGLEYSNLRLIRAFEHGLDPSSSEAGFVLVHVDMVKNSGPLIDGVISAMDACANDDREAFDFGMQKVVQSMIKINKVMDGMWAKSKPGDYNSFRTFIFGIASQSMFPNGVIYEGVSSSPQSFRGESGANDSMIPLLDTFLQITMPSTPLTTILHSFLPYRPTNHLAFLQSVSQSCDSLSPKSYALSAPSSSLLHLRALDQVRDFRWRHWCFAREYILKRSAHPTATGGSPVVTWLPNQLGAVLDAMVEMGDVWREGELGSEGKELIEGARGMRERLRREVERWCVERGVGP